MNPCMYCINRKRDVCSPCREEGKYSSLAPETLKNWEIPDLPPYYELVDMEAAKVRAIFYLMLYYMHKKVYHGA